MLTDKHIEDKLRGIRFTTSEGLDRRIRTGVSTAHFDGAINDCTVAEPSQRACDPDVNIPIGVDDTQSARPSVSKRLATTVRRVAGFTGAVLLYRSNTKRSFSRSLIVATRIAASVMLFAGAVSLAVMLVVPGTSIVLADVVEKSTQAKSVTFVLKVKSGNRTVLDVKSYLQGNGLRCELPNGIVYVENAKERKELYLDMPNKEAAYYDFPKDAASLWNTHPIQWLQQVTKPDDAKFLGHETLEGCEVEVFLTKQIGVFTKGTKSYGFAPEHTIKIWVDPQTELPLKIEVRDPHAKNVMTFAQMKWNEPLGFDLFRLDVPDGFTEQSAESFRSRLPKTTGRPLED